MLQEASGAAGHPSYRRYHYGTGPLLVEDGANRRFISTDALGSTTDLTITGATVASMRKYDAWGQYRNDTAPVASEPKLGFTGHQYDPETGLVYARARYYDPDLGRFISRDTYEGALDDAPSLHRFAYAWMNPVRYWDRTGYATEGQEPVQAPQPVDESESGGTACFSDTGACATPAPADAARDVEADQLRANEARRRQAAHDILQAAGAPTEVTEEDEGLGRRVLKAVGDVDQAARDAATGLVHDAATTTVDAIAGHNMRPPETASEVQAQARRAERYLGNEAVDQAEGALVGGTVAKAGGGVLRKALGGRKGAKAVAAAESRAAQAEAKAVAMEEKALAKEVAEGTGAYRDVAGHHVHAKKAFEGVPGYDFKEAFSVSDDVLRTYGVRHADITAAQQQLFREFAKSGSSPLTRNDPPLLTRSEPGTDHDARVAPDRAVG